MPSILKNFESAKIKAAVGYADSRLQFQPLTALWISTSKILNADNYCLNTIIRKFEQI